MDVGQGIGPHGTAPHSRCGPVTRNSRCCESGSVPRGHSQETTTVDVPGAQRATGTVKFMVNGFSHTAFTLFPRDFLAFSPMGNFQQTFQRAVSTVASVDVNWNRVAKTLGST